MSLPLQGIDPQGISQQDTECVADLLRNVLDEEAKLAKLCNTKYLTISGTCDRTIPFQTDILEHYDRHDRFDFLLEAATGSGKTYVAAFISERVVMGDVVYICHSLDILHQAREKFVRVMPDRHREMGFPNEVTKMHKIHFLTTACLVGLVRSRDPVVNGILDRACLFVIDESHHYPEDNKARLVVFGEVEKISREMFLAKGKRVLAMTATHSRMDGLKPMGRGEPDFSFTVQDSVDSGRCPPVHGMQVRINVTPDGVRKSGDFYDTKMTPQKRSVYLSSVVGNMAIIYQRIPKPFCAFVRTVKDAEDIAKEFNRVSGLGDRGLAILVGKTKKDERKRIIEGITSGDMAGYITCNVGAEGIDIPSIEVVHLILKTSSDGRLVQMIGRSLRANNGKDRALVVDYHFAKDFIIRGCVGLFQYGMVANSWVARQFGNNITTVCPIVVRTSDKSKVMEWKARLSRMNEEVWVSQCSKKEEAENEWREVCKRWTKWCVEHGRFPSSSSSDKEEAELGVWMNRQRANSTLKMAAKAAIRDAQGRIIRG